MVLLLMYIHRQLTRWCQYHRLLVVKKVKKKIREHHTIKTADVYPYSYTVALVTRGGDKCLPDVAAREVQDGAHQEGGILDNDQSM